MFNVLSFSTHLPIPYLKKTVSTIWTFFCLIIFALYHQKKITFSTINNQTLQLNVAVKTSGYSKKNFHVPSPAMKSLLVF